MAGIFKRINNQDQSTRTFKVYKSWGYTDSASIDNNNIDRLVAIKPNPNNFSGKVVTLDSIQINNDASAYLQNTVNNKEAAVIWYSLDHLYYKRNNIPYDTFGYSNESKNRTLYDQATILAIPQIKFGEQIKPGSVNLSMNYQGGKPDTYNQIFSMQPSNYTDTITGSAAFTSYRMYFGTASLSYDTLTLFPTASAGSTQLYFVRFLKPINPSVTYSYTASVNVDTTSYANKATASLYFLERPTGSGNPSTTVDTHTYRFTGSHTLVMSGTFVPDSDPNKYYGVNLANVSNTAGQDLVFSNYQLFLNQSYVDSFSPINFDLNVTDDEFGNLIDSDLSSPISNELLYLDFNKLTYEPIWVNSVNTSSYNNESIYQYKIKTVIPDLQATFKNIAITKKYGFTGSYMNWGNTAYFYNNSYIRLYNQKEYNFTDTDDFAISFWMNRSNAAMTGSGYVLSKRTTGYGNTYNPNSQIITGDISYNNSQYPFDIYIESGSNKLICRQSNGSIISVVTSSIMPGAKTHIVVQKTGSNFELYLNGNVTSTATLPSGNTNNLSDIFIGSLGLDSNKNGVSGYQGSIDEFFIFNKGLNSSEILQLSSTNVSSSMSTNTNIVGNVFYEHGIVVLSDPRPKYGVTITSGSYRIFNDKLINTITNETGSNFLNSIDFSYNSTITLHEHEYICKMRGDEFNFTTNPTIRLGNSEQNQFPKEFVANENWGPYITTVGLYNDKGELLAIGKLSNPIKKRENVDTNIIVRFDISS